MQQKGLCLPPVAVEVLGCHREPPVAADLAHGHHHGDRPNHGRPQHGESGPHPPRPRHPTRRKS